MITSFTEYEANANLITRIKDEIVGMANAMATGDAKTAAIVETKIMQIKAAREDMLQFEAEHPPLLNCLGNLEKATVILIGLQQIFDPTDTDSHYGDEFKELAREAHHEIGEIVAAVLDQMYEKANAKNKFSTN